MKSAIVLMAAALLVVPLTAGAVGQFALTSDVSGSSCQIVDDGEVVQVHMFVENAGEVMAVQYAAPVPACWAGAIWLEDTMAYPVNIGDTQLIDPRGMSVAFGECKSSPVYLGYMSFATSGQGASCCDFPVIKATNDGHPEIDGPIMVACPDTQHVVGLSSGAIINADVNCGCEQVLPTENSTWGAVKSLYR